MDLDINTQILNSKLILKSIFDYLNFNEQIPLTYVCKKFNSFVKQVMWRDKFNVIKIHKTRYVNLLTRTANMDTTELAEVRTPKLALNHGRLSEFINSNGKSIEILFMHAKYSDYDEDIETRFPELQLFENLKELTYFRMILTDEDLRIIAANCLQLRKLSLIECYCEHLQFIVPGLNINIENFFKIKQLQELIMHGWPSRRISRIRYNVYQNLLNKLKLKCLILKNFEIDMTSKVKVSNQLCIHSMETLNVGNINKKIFDLFINHLEYFCNLIDLTLNFNDFDSVVNLKVIEALANKCKNLQILLLQSCVLDVPDFCKLENLKELTLKFCNGLTFSNLQQILGGLQLQTFKLINTPVENIYNQIFISPSLQSLTIDSVHYKEISEIFKKSLTNLENVDTLNWYNGDITGNWLIDKCPHLKYLHIRNGNSLSHKVFTSKSLREITLTSCSHLTWRMILLLVKLSLKELTILTTGTIIDDEEIFQNSFKTTRTSLECITMPYRIFKQAQDSWLDLIYLNKQLKFLIFGNNEEILNVGFMVNLLRREQFQNRFDAIKICGFTLEIHGLRYNVFMEKFVYLFINTSHYKERNINFTIEF